ncbi:MAG TPA: cytochrome b/b6 domain-containing protein [Rhodopila sp.]|uniref:cytochrome b/b6 domain-containing protein n=1 Tax=Rhodopila sp. TaxID=2480087 RepID=UPI002B7053DD|nr:cytochrome b/b6 domain-containing protein [Rhodopila sp.]HVY14519.1 cytochrome b/b6 domain-containing protein [Rhodopila sp.]
MRRIKVWDLPVRLFHWMLAALVFLAWASQEWNYMDWHVLIGYAILTLVLFRMIWGLVGSDTARFGRFLRSPFAALGHLRHIHRREPDQEIGHNAAGGWMVLVMLALVVVQAGTGLFANDDGDTEGPLMHLVSKGRSDWLSHIHSVNFTLIEIAVCLHVFAILVYAVLKRQDLVRPMITGTKAMPAGTAAPRLVSPLWAILALGMAAGAVALLIRI